MFVVKNIINMESISSESEHSKRLAPYETPKKHRTSTEQALYMTVK